MFCKLDEKFLVAEVTELRKEPTTIVLLNNHAVKMPLSIDAHTQILVLPLAFLRETSYCSMWWLMLNPVTASSVENKEGGILGFHCDGYKTFPKAKVI